MSGDDGWRRQAREHVAGQRPDLALALYVEHLESSRGVPALAAVRLSFWLSEWAELARSYPPARSALRELRSAAVARLLEPAGDGSALDDSAPDDFAEVAAISTRLGEPGAPAEVFARLHEQAPEVALRCAPEARRHLVAAGAFGLARACLTDPPGTVDRIADVFGQRLSRGFTHVAEDRREAQRARAVRDYVTAVREVLAILEGTGEDDLARSVRSRAVDAVGWPHVRDDVEAALLQGVA